MNYRKLYWSFIMDDFDLTLIQQAQFDAWFNKKFPVEVKNPSRFITREIALAAYKAAVYNSL